jgi:hypothetical protein
MFGWRPKHQVPKRDPLSTAKEKITALVAEHIKTLGAKRLKGVRIDDYNVVDASRWNKEVQYFVDKVVKPRLTIEEIRAVVQADLSRVATELIEEPARLEVQRIQAAIEQRKGEARPSSQRGSPHPGLSVSSGLIIRAEPLADILDGYKTWEMRSTRTTKRETIALIQKGAKAIYGVAEIVDCIGPLSTEEMIRSYHNHRIDGTRLDDPEVVKWRFAYVLDNIERIRPSIPCEIRPGAVTFVTLDEAAAYALAENRRAKVS